MDVFIVGRLKGSQTKIDEASSMTFFHKLWDVENIVVVVVL
jgi:hypothetical protein